MPIPFQFCPLCATPLLHQRIPDDGPERDVCPSESCGFVNWGNSKASASAIVEGEDGRILLSRRARNPFRGLWDIPGGFLESGEHPETAVIRELLEETGMTVRVERMIGVYMDTYGPPPSDDTLNFYYVCRVIEGEPEAKDDVDAIGWFGLDEIPHPIAFDNANAALRDYLEQVKVLA